jgi:hypothetical protein
MMRNHYRLTTIEDLGQGGKRVGITDLRPYDATRNSLTVQPLNSGTSIHTISEILGYSSMKIKVRYAHQEFAGLRKDS